MIIFFFIAFFRLTPIDAFAQNVSYLDADHKPVTSGNYTYKRVVKYKEPIINPNLGTGYYGNITASPQPSGLHICSLIDYYRTGDPAYVANVITVNPNCSEWEVDGIAISYFKSGSIKQKTPYKVGKLHGTVVTYDESGNELRRLEYQNGKLIEVGKFVVSANNPLIGTWRYEERTAPFVAPQFNINRPGSLTKLVVADFSAN